ncbi:MAG: PEP-CTERM sorting domain-containing protein [Luteolibacter sp.]|jgi:hypothetical protein|nr:PEP-CTERM sorting domain-containing protein [Luteolibacter sp.]
MHPSIPKFCLAAALALTNTTTHAASILNNTDFEAFALAAAANIPITRADYESKETSLETPSWAFSGVAGYLASGGASSGFWGSSSRFDSSQFVVLGNFSDGETSSTLVQTFTLAAAGSYDFSFDWQSGTFADNSSYLSSVGGFGLLSMRIFVPGGDDAGYIEILTEDDQQGTLTANTVALPAGALAIEIRYDFEFGGGNYNHVFLDNVQATAVPEPSTALLAVTVAGIALRRRRR